MRKIYSLLIVLTLAKITFAQTTYIWIGGVTGDYQVAANWSPARSAVANTDVLSFNVATPIEVTNVPLQTVGAIEINGGINSVVFSTNSAANILTLNNPTPLIFTSAGSILAGDILTIQLSSNSSFSMSSGVFGISPNTGGKISVMGALVLSGGKLDFDVSGTGGTNISGSITYNSGTFNSANTNAITWAGSATYFHASNGAGVSAIPVSNWSSGSNCIITGMNTGTTAPIIAAGANFSNFAWNCAAQLSDVDFPLPLSAVYINGTFSIVNTNNNYVRLSDAIISCGSYNQTGGNIMLQSASGSSTLTVNGTFTHSAGVLDGVGGTSIGTARLNLKGDVTKSGSSAWSTSSSSSAAQTTIEFSGGATQNIMIVGSWNAPVAGRSNITVSNTSATGIYLATGSILNVFNTGSSSAAKCTMAGIIAPADATAVLKYTGTATYPTELVYSGSLLQTATAAEYPNTNGPFNLTIAAGNTLGVSFPASFNRTITGTLKLQGGNFDVGGGNTLSLTNTILANQLSYTSGFISSGTLGRFFPTTGLPTTPGATSLFPLGTGANDRALNVFFSSATLTGGAAGMIFVSHTPSVNTSPISITDGTINLDKRTNTFWTISYGSFNCGSSTISLLAVAANIGSVDFFNDLRLTDGATSFGTWINPNTGSNAVPITGKAGLGMANINNQNLYIGGAANNPLIIITFTWTGLGANGDWTNPANWTSTALGYPSASTEIAIINTTSGTQPTVNTTDNLNIYQVTVGTGMTLTMSGNARINVFDAVNFTGNAVFGSTSTFTYAQSGGTQTLVDLPYTNLSIAGTAVKRFPANITITGVYTLSGAAPDVTTNTNTFTFTGTGSQYVPPAKYYNLKITGNRGGGIIRLGLPNNSTKAYIDIANIFDVSMLTNFTNPPTAPFPSFTTVNFSSAGTQTIPGFPYPENIENSGNGPRVLDPLGATNPANVIYIRNYDRGTGAYTVTGSKINFFTIGNKDYLYYLYNHNFNDLVFSGNHNGYKFEIADNTSIYILGKFANSLTNYKQVINNVSFVFNGVGDQTIPGFKTNGVTPAFKYPNIVIQGGNRNVTLSSTDTIGITGKLQVPLASSNQTVASIVVVPFSAGKGFIVNGSTVNFSTGSDIIPQLFPSVSGAKNYENIVVSSGTRSMDKDGMIIGGNLSVGMDSATASVTSSSTLKVGNGASNRTLNVLGNVSIWGLLSSPSTTGQVDMNTGTDGTTTLNLAGNLTISGNGQLMGTTTNGTANGTVIFNGVTPQTYSNTSTTFKNGRVNFTVGNSTTVSNLILGSSIDLLASNIANNKCTLSVRGNAAINCGTNNIISNGAGNAIFSLSSGSTFITANTGGIEGIASNGTNGTITDDAGVVAKTYNTSANYVFNGATITPFPAAITFMANLTINANISLNRAIVANGTLDLTSFTLTQAANNLQFAGLTNTTGNIYADKSSTLSIRGNLPVGTLRFGTGGNITGQLTINRTTPTIVPLGSDLTIDKTPLSGNFITGSATDVLDINGNTLTINGTTTGAGTLSGSATSNVTLGNTSSTSFTINFTSGKQVLKNLTLLNAANPTLGTPLDITGGAAINSEGTLSITGTSKLTSSGNLTIKSNGFGTARVAAGAIAGGYIIGDVTVERFLDAKRAWRFLAAPTVGQTFKQSWQENQAAGVNPGTGYGTIITSNLGGWAAAGFDFSSPSNSLLIYNAATNVWAGAAATNVAISALGGNNSYMLFSRGDRSVLPSMGTGATPTTVLTRTKGTLFQGNLPAVAVAAGKFAAIGNNYAAAIDFSLINKLNIDESFDVWDPKLGSLGAWVKFAFVNGWKPLISGGTYDVNSANQRIESGQAFMVHNVTATNGSVALLESSKINQSRLVARPAGITGATSQIFKSHLYNISGSNNNIIDANVVVFSEDYSNVIDGKDALKMSNFTENFGIQKGNQTLVVEARQPLVDSDTIFFNFNKVKRQPYRLEFVAENFDNNVVGYLEDKFLDNTTLIQMNGKTTVDFSINTDPASAVADRFRVVFIKVLPLPVKFTSISATQQNTAIALKWTVENEINISKYDVEKSTNGVNFIKINTTNATGTNNSSTTYNFLDITPLQGNNFYRIRSYNQSGSFDYSKIVLVKLGKSGTGITVYPNPVKDNQLGISFNNMEKGVYQMRLINSLGQTMLAKQLIHPGGSSMVMFKVERGLSAGIYQMEIITQDNKRNTVKVIVQ